jgi:hypothetical protein
MDESMILLDIQYGYKQGGEVYDINQESSTPYLAASPKLNKPWAIEPFKRTLITTTY